MQRLRGLKRSEKSRVFFFVLIGLLGVSFCHAAEKQPNFVVILCDDLGWGDLGCFGHPHIKTPNLDRLAQQGTRLTNCYSPAPVCSPSRVGLLTGRSPIRAGVVDWIPEVKSSEANSFKQRAKSKAADSRSLVHMRREEITLPKLLQKAGYATGLVGKWHCNSMFNSALQPQPKDAGFDHWFATQNNAGPSHENPNNFVRNGEWVGALEGFSCQLVAQEAIHWMKQTKSEKPGNPFFLYVAFHEPHEPVASPSELVAKYASVTDSEDQAQYFANVENMDNAVGKILNALAEQGVVEETLVYFTSDNGPETLNRYLTAKRSHGSAGNLKGHKLWTTEAGVRVPGIIRCPDGMRLSAKIGEEVNEPVSSLDLMPSILSLAGLGLPVGHELDGADFTPLLLGEKIQRTKPLFWFYWAAINDQRVAMREGDWKLLAKLNGGALPNISNINEANVESVRKAELTDFSLFNLANDPGELKDLALQEPEQLAKLTQKLRALYRDVTGSMHVWPKP